MGYKDKFEDPEKPIDDEPRIDQLSQHIEEVANAIQAGSPEKGHC